MKHHEDGENNNEHVNNYTFFFRPRTGHGGTGGGGVRGIALLFL
jgi:hypothetical protein